MRLLMAVAVVLSGCSIDGTPCEKAGEHRCDGPDIAYCERSGEWKTYACPGVCDALTGNCNWKGVKAGDLCSEEANGAGICTANGELTMCLYSSSDKVGRFQAVPCGPCEKDKRLQDLVSQSPDGLYHCN